MKLRHLAFLAALAFAVAPLSQASAETNIVNGQMWVCEDGVCRLVGDAPEDFLASLAPSASVPEQATRMLLGYREVDDFLAFLSPDAASSEAEGGALATFTWLSLVVVRLGGLAMNLTPCVLPMIPVNLIVIGKSPARGAVYGLGMALAYGVLGVLAAVGGMAFGTIQSNPWFNVFVALVFVALGASLFGFFSIDFSRFRSGVVKPDASRAGLAVPFFLGALSAVLAGACVAPILVSVLVLTARLYAEGNAIALALPFVLGLGMALPWPFLGAGMKVLPKPGAWMKHVNRVFAVIVLLFAAYYGYLAWKGWTRGTSTAPKSDGIPGAVEATPDTFEDVFAEAEEKGKPILVDCWATWCKNCFAMERTTLADKRVREALSGYTVIRLQADDMKGFKKLEPFKDVQGLPTYAIFEVSDTGKDTEE